MTSSYPAASGYQPNPAYAGMAATPYPSSAPIATKQSPVLGIVGLALVVVATLICLFSVRGLLTAYLQVFPLESLEAGSIDFSQISDSQVNELMAVSGGPMGGLVLASLMGLAGLIVSIVATVKKKGFPFGIAGIVVGIVGPVIAYVIGAAIAM
jgi:MFS family permease